MNPGQWGSNQLNVILCFGLLNWYEWHVLVLPGALKGVYRDNVSQYQDSGAHAVMLKSMQVIWR